MKKKKDIIVWDQFDQVDIKEEENHANEEKVPTFTRNYEIDELSRMQKITHHIKKLKPFLIAMFSALFIGSVLGFVMLNFLTNVNDQPNNAQQHAVSNQATVENETYSAEAQPDEQQTEYNLNAMRSHVLQVGVFNEKENAEMWMSTYTSNGLPMSLWQRDEQYFLFAGIAATKNAADLIASEIESEDVEIYVKEWETPEYKVNVSKREYQWLQSFQEQWEQSLQEVSTNGSMNNEEWQNLIEQASLEDVHIEPLLNELTNWIDDLMDKNDPVLEQEFLLDIWQQFISVVNL